MREVQWLALAAVVPIGAYPDYWVSTYGCGQLISSATLGTGMNNGGYAEQTDVITHSESGGVFSLTMPAGRWFITAASGTFAPTRAKNSP